MGVHKSYVLGGWANKSGTAKATAGRDTLTATIGFIVRNEPPKEPSWENFFFFVLMILPRSNMLNFVIFTPPHIRTRGYWCIYIYMAVNFGINSIKNQSGIFRKKREHMSNLIFNYLRIFRLKYNHWQPFKKKTIPVFYFITWKNVFFYIQNDSFYFHVQ